MREPVRESGLQRDLLEEFLNATRYLAPGDNPVGREDLRDRGADLHSRIKAVVRVLEDDLDIPPVPLQAPPPETQHVMPLEEHFAADGRTKPHNCPTDCALTRAALSHQAQAKRPGRKPERYPIHGPDSPEMYPQIADLQEEGHELTPATTILGTAAKSSRV